MTIWLFLMSLANATPLPELLQGELQGANKHFQTLDETPHYIALSVLDAESIEMTAIDGAIGPMKNQRMRTLDTDLRVGTAELDSTHELRGFSGFEGSSRMRVTLPFEDGHNDVVKHIVWRELDKAYRNHAERIVMLRANQLVKVAEEDPAPDFEPREPIKDAVPVPELTIDENLWRGHFERMSRIINDSPHVHRTALNLNGVRQQKTFVDSEGTVLEHGRRHVRISLTLHTRAEDGDQIHVFRAFDVHNPDTLPKAEVLDDWAAKALQHLLALRKAPRAEPYTGPVLLKGKATGVFFHEVFGHRVEGHRQKSDFEGKTFADHVGHSILPDFIEVYDDPTRKQYGDVDLNGYYHYDDEGVQAQRAELVKEGEFQGFLMGRSPIPGFEHSNGHGRRMSGYAPVSRMGNTIITASETQTDAQLRAGLIRQMKKQKLDYAYVVEDIDGGFTMTGRVTPNAFNVRANTTYRVYADGRPDELVRGIDLVGTPMVAFKSILAAGNDMAVFNGHCGAESGYVPVSAVAPSVLVGRLEFQRKEKGADKPPLRPKPNPNDAQSDAGEVLP